MRKDVRLGLGVGGILFGVVLIYVLFFAGGNDPDEFAGDFDSAASGSITSDGTSAAAAESPAPTASGAPLVDTGSMTGIGGTPAVPTPVGGNNGAGSTSSASSTANRFPAPPTATVGPTTRPIGSVATGDAGTPINSGAWNWRDLVNHGAKNGELLSRTETPTPVGARPPVDPRTIRIEPPAEPLPDIGPALPSTGPRVHVVKSGESFWSIAKNEYGNPSYYSHLARANPRVDPAKLKAGMRISIPPKDEVVPRTVAMSTRDSQQIDETRQYRVQKGDSLSTIASKLYGRAAMADRIYQANRDVIGANPSALKLNVVLTLPETPTRTLAAGSTD